MSENCEQTDIKKAYYGENQVSNGTYCSVLGEVCSPLGREMTDVDTRYQQTPNYNFVPYTYKGDISLEFFDRMAQLSPTHGSIIQSQVKWAIGIGTLVQVKGRKGWGESEKIVANELQTLEYNQFIENTLVNEADLIQYIRKAAQNFKQNGNIWLEVVLVEVAGVKQARIVCHDSQNVRYVAAKREDLVKEAYLSQSFDFSYLSQVAPTKIAVFPAWTQDEEGVWRTLIHHKQATVGSYWYGKMDSIQALYDIYKEYQLGDYTTKGYDMDWSAKVFIETYDTAGIEDEEENKSGNNDAKNAFDTALRQTFTNGGARRKTVMHRNQPAGKEQATSIHEFHTQKDHEFDQVVANMAEKNIYKAHDWHVILMDSVPGRLGGGSDFMDIAELKFYTTIFPLQKNTLAPFHTALKAIEQFLGYENPSRLELGLESLFEFMSKKRAVQAAQEQQAKQQNAATNV